MPAPIIQHSDQNCTCTDCIEASEPGTLARVLALIATVVILLVLAAAARAREGKHPEPIPAPPALLAARAACPNGSTLVHCRTELRHALEHLAWQRATRLHQRTLPASNLTPLEVGAALAKRHAWSGPQFVCLAHLWSRESGWRPSAVNRAGSGAYGIPQALPGKKMAAMGRDWRTNAATQIRWGLRYVAQRYGSPCAALAHSYLKGWY